MINPKNIGHRVYVVVWPDDLIIKAGYTEQRRWRTFIGRGAYAHALTLFASCSDALGYEGVLHEYLHSTARPAFKAGADAEPYLGNRGDGYLECFRASDLALLDALPQAPDGQCVYGPHGVRLTPTHALPDAIHVLNERTDVLTDEYSTRSISHQSHAQETKPNFAPPGGWWVPQTRKGAQR